jgi:hypothetical protein
MRRLLTCGFSLLIAAIVIFFANMGASAATKSEEGQGYIHAVERLWQWLSGSAEPGGFRFGVNVRASMLVCAIDTRNREQRLKSMTEPSMRLIGKTNRETVWSRMPVGRQVVRF